MMLNCVVGGFEEVRIQMLSSGIRGLTPGNRSPPATLPKPNDWPAPKFRPRRIAKKLFYFSAPERVVGF